jgi:hypothetical protein
VCADHDHNIKEVNKAYFTQRQFRAGAPCALCTVPIISATMVGRAKICNGAKGCCTWVVLCSKCGVTTVGKKWKPLVEAAAGGATVEKQCQLKSKKYGGNS